MMRPLTTGNVCCERSERFHFALTEEGPQTIVQRHLASLKASMKTAAVR